jgi:hypothetical protein
MSRNDVSSEWKESSFSSLEHTVPIREIEKPLLERVVLVGTRVA